MRLKDEQGNRDSTFEMDLKGQYHHLKNRRNKHWLPE